MDVRFWRLWTSDSDELNTASYILGYRIVSLYISYHIVKCSRLRYQIISWYMGKYDTVRYIGLLFSWRVSSNLTSSDQNWASSAEPSLLCLPLSGWGLSIHGLSRLFFHDLVLLLSLLTVTSLWPYNTSHRTITISFSVMGTAVCSNYSNNQTNFCIWTTLSILIQISLL